MYNNEEEDHNLREQVSAISHWIWAKWMKHVKSKDKMRAVDEVDAIRWDRQMKSEYETLPENEKFSNRQIADQIIADWEYDPYTGKRLRRDEDD